MEARKEDENPDKPTKKTEPGEAEEKPPEKPESGEVEVKQTEEQTGEEKQQEENVEGDEKPKNPTQEKTEDQTDKLEKHKEEKSSEDENKQITETAPASATTPVNDIPTAEELLEATDNLEPTSTGIGMDAAVTPLRHGGLSLVQTTDFFYPLVDDPYMMGKIACANVLSDLYAMGVMDCDNMLMLLGVSNKMSDKERDTVIPMIMRGFKDLAEEAGSQVTGGQTVINPWLTVGGVASTVCQPNEFIMPDNAVVGDVLVMTKPLGTQVAVNAYQWLDQPERWNRVKLVVTEDDVRKAYQRAMFSMARMNRTAARLMHKYNAHGATDITGFGLLGHAKNLAKIQKNEVSFVIHNLPIIAKMASISKACGNMFALLQGQSAETSGGLLMALPREQAAAFCKDIEKQEGYQSWIIGIVEKGNRTARIIDKPRVIEVPAKDRDGELW